MHILSSWRRCYLLGKCLRNILDVQRRDIQSLVKSQAEVLVKACLCLLNSVPLHPQLPLNHLPLLAIRIQSLTVINDASEEGNGRWASLPQTALASCLFIMSDVLNRSNQDPNLCWSPFEPIRFMLFQMT